MPRGRLSKADMLSRVMKLKHDVFNRTGKYSNFSHSQLESANYTLNKVLEIIEEYSQ
jgi:hypothetical protein